MNWIQTGNKDEFSLIEGPNYVLLILNGRATLTNTDKGSTLIDVALVDEFNDPFFDAAQAIASIDKKSLKKQSEPPPTKSEDFRAKLLAILDRVARGDRFQSLQDAVALVDSVADVLNSGDAPVVKS